METKDSQQRDSDEIAAEQQLNRRDSGVIAREQRGGGTGGRGGEKPLERR